MKVTEQTEVHSEMVHLHSFEVTSNTYLRFYCSSYQLPLEEQYFGVCDSKSNQCVVFNLTELKGLAGASNQVNDSLIGRQIGELKDKIKELTSD